MYRRILFLIKKMTKSLSVSFGLNYQNTASVTNLEACIKDANNLQDLLSGQGYQSTLQVDSNKGLSVNNFKNRIVDAIKQAPTNLTVTFAGHGTSVRDLTGDEDDGFDEALIFHDDKLLDDDFKEFLYNSLKESEIENLFFIFDCCRSGSICDLKYRGIDSEKSSKEDKYCLSKLKTNILCISACTDSQNALEVSNGGFLTQSLISNFKEVSMLELFNSVRKDLGNYQTVSVSSNKRVCYSSSKLFKEIVEDKRMISEGKTTATCGNGCSIM
jgi:hypothetical protein